MFKRILILLFLGLNFSGCRPDSADEQSSSYKVVEVRMCGLLNEDGHCKQDYLNLVRHDDGRSFTAVDLHNDDEEVFLTFQVEGSETLPLHFVLQKDQEDFFDYKIDGADLNTLHTEKIILNKKLEPGYYSFSYIYRNSDESYFVTNTYSFVLDEDGLVGIDRFKVRN